MALPQPPILYQGIYGVEPFKDVAGVGPADFGGGANNTQQNLLVSMWTVDPVTLAFEELVRPAYATPYGEEQAQLLAASGLLITPAVFGRNVFDSRTTARFSFSLTDQGGESPYDFPFCAILNPPQDLKNDVQLLMRNFAAGNTSAQVVKSFYHMLCWSVSARQLTNSGAGASLAGPVTNVGAFFGSVLSPPFVLTDGSDGTAPQLPPNYPPTTPEDFIGNYRDSFMSGDFYIPMFFSIDTAAAPNGTYLFDVVWPHSGARTG